MTIVYIFLIIVATNVLTALFESLRQEKRTHIDLIDKKVNSITKDEFEQKVRKIQSNELSSEKFKLISNLMEKYYSRENIKLEDKLFGIVGNYIVEDNLFNKKINEKKLDRAKRFGELNKFINSLSQEQIESNLYLQMAVKLLKTSETDCKYVIKLLRNEIDLCQINKIIKTITIDINIPQATCDLLPLRVSEQVGISYYNPEKYNVYFADVLDEKNKHIYTEYNRYVSKIDKLASDIYLLQMWNLLSVYPEEIDNYYFQFLNSSVEHKILTGFFVKQTEPEENKQIYEINDKTKKNVSNIVGLPFEEITSMEPNKLDDYLEEKRISFKL